MIILSDCAYHLRRITVMSSLNETDQLGNTELRDRDDIP
jgi:hypothetical protein